MEKDPQPASDAQIDPNNGAPNNRHERSLLKNYLKNESQLNLGLGNPRGFSLMQELAANDLAANQLDAELKAISESPEVAALNDKAMFEIYGSRLPVKRMVDGKEVTEFIDYTISDPDTGEIIGTPDQPYTGVLDEIRTNRRYGNTEAEREQAAKDYETEINNLVDQGFELAQAKLIQDMRYADSPYKASMIGKFISEGGMNPVAAAEKVEAIYAKRDTQRQKLIKENVIFTTEQYDKLTASPENTRNRPAITTPNKLPKPAAKQNLTPEKRNEASNTVTSLTEMLKKDVASVYLASKRRNRRNAVAEYARSEEGQGALGEIAEYLKDTGFSPKEISQVLDEVSAEVYNSYEKGRVGRLGKNLLHYAIGDIYQPEPKRPKFKKLEKELTVAQKPAVKTPVTTAPVSEPTKQLTAQERAHDKFDQQTKEVWADLDEEPIVPAYEKGQKLVIQGTKGPRTIYIAADYDPTKAPGTFNVPFSLKQGGEPKYVMPASYLAEHTIHDIDEDEDKNTQKAAANA